MHRVYLNKYSLVAVKFEEEYTLSQIADLLGFQLIHDKQESITQAYWEGGNWLTLYKNTLLIVPDHIFSFFNNIPSGLELELLTKFKVKMLCAAFRNTVSDMYGYSFVEDKYRRVKLMEMDDAHSDFGALLEIEKAGGSEEIHDWIFEKVTGIEFTYLLSEDINMIYCKEKS